MRFVCVCGSIMGCLIFTLRDSFSKHSFTLLLQLTFIPSSCFSSVFIFHFHLIFLQRFDRCALSLSLSTTAYQKNYNHRSTLKYHSAFVRFHLNSNCLRDSFTCICFSVEFSPSSHSIPFESLFPVSKRDLLSCGSSFCLEQKNEVNFNRNTVVRKKNIIWFFFCFG